MIIGVPKEIKNNENRVGMTPAGVAELVKKEVIQCMYRHLPVQTAVFLMKSTLQWVRKCCQPSKLRMPQLK